MDSLPKCGNEECVRHGKDLYVYTDGGFFFIGICYACGAFDAKGADPEILEEFIQDTELLLELIKDGELYLLNDIVPSIGKTNLYK